MRRVGAAVLALGVLVSCAGCPASSPTATATRSFTPRSVTADRAATSSAAEPTTARPGSSSTSPAHVNEPSSTPAVPAFARILDARITGPLTGAVLISSCQASGHPCTFRVDTTTDSGRTWRRGTALGGR